SRLLARVVCVPGELPADWMRETNVRDQAVTEESGYTSSRAVHELIRNHELQRLGLFFERSNRAERKDDVPPPRLHTVNVGAKVELGGGVAMPASMTGKECYLFSFQAAHNVRVGRSAPRRVQLPLFCCVKSGHGIQSTAPNNADFRSHSCMSSKSTPP